MKSTSFPQFIFGYHGCDRAVGEAVLSGKAKLNPSMNIYDWLGSGIYFWEQSPRRALEWAQSCVDNPKMTNGQIKEPFVLGAIINLGLCLNLTDVSSMQTLQTAYSILVVRCKENHHLLPTNTEHLRELDNQVINLAAELSKLRDYGNFDTVRGAFIEGNPIYPGANISDHTHIQVCVRHPDCISGYFLPANI